MRRALGVSLTIMAVLTVGGRAFPAEADPDQEKAVAVVKRLGGKVEIDQSRLGKLVVAVDLLFAKTTDEDLAQLKVLTSLERLDLGGRVSKFTNSGLAALEGMKNLRSLSLAGSKITDGGLSHIKGLTELRRLNLGKLITDAGLEHLKDLTNMEDLDLAGNKITDAGLKHLAGMKKLKRLDLSNTLITDAGLEHLKGFTELKQLFLYANHGITDAGLKHLAALKQLKYLDLTATKITDNGGNDLQKELPNTKIFR